MPNRRPIGVDLFSGAGGMTLGFEQAGFDVLASVELDPIHCATHEFNFPFWSVLCANVEFLTGYEIRNRSAIGDSDIDVVFGGPPCQGFSLIGKRCLSDPRNSLVFHFMRLVVELQPKYFVMENVSGLVVGKHKKFLMELIEEFESNGYSIEREYNVLNAAYYGVPQDRRRLFLLGCRNKYTLPRYPEPISRPINCTGDLLSLYEKLPLCPSVWDAIGDLPDVDQYDTLLDRDWLEVVWGNNSSDYARILRGIIPDPNDRSYLRECDLNVLTSSLRTIHTNESIERFRRTKPGDTEPISRFRKLDPKGICNTLRAGTASNRGAFTSPRPIHPYSPRCITVREAARLHSYPDWFRFHVTKWHGFRQVGNSVPPWLARSVGNELIRVLGIKSSKSNVRKKLGEPSLLEMNMSQAAERYGVDPRVIEPRKRTA